MTGPSASATARSRSRSSTFASPSPSRTCSPTCPRSRRGVTLVNQSDFYGERYPVRRARAGDRDRAFQHHGRRLDAGHLAHAYARVVDDAAARPRASRARAERRTARPPPARSGSCRRRMPRAKVAFAFVSHDAHVEAEVAPRRGEQRRAVAQRRVARDADSHRLWSAERGRRRALRGRRAPAATASRRRGPPARAARSPGASAVAASAWRSDARQARRAQRVDGGEARHVHGVADGPVVERGADVAERHRRLVELGRGERARRRDAARPGGRRSSAAPRRTTTSPARARTTWNALDRRRELTLVARHAAASAAATARRRARRGACAAAPRRAGSRRTVSCRDSAAGERERYESQRKNTMVSIAKMIATAIVTRVRFRSTMCVPPCDCGVKPIPPMPGVAARVHEDQAHEGHRDEDVQDGENLKHRGPRVADASGTASDDLHDGVDQLARDPVLRHVAGRAGRAAPCRRRRARSSR